MRPDGKSIAMQIAPRGTRKLDVLRGLSAGGRGTVIGAGRATGHLRAFRETPRGAAAGGVHDARARSA